jgi:hypothetical protein
MKNITKKEIVIVSIFSALVSLTNILHVIFGFLQTPAGYVYIADGHYYLDYLYYLMVISQGMAGRWLTANYLTVGDNYTNIRGTPYILLGHLARIFHLTSQFIYWLTVFILGFLLVFMFYLTIRKILPDKSVLLRIIILAIGVFSTPFYKMVISAGQLNLVPYDYWYGPSIFIRRFGAVPYHLLSSILILWLILYLSEALESFGKKTTTGVLKKAVTVSLIVIFLLMFSPFNLINLAVAVGITAVIYFKRKVHRYLIFFLTMGALILPAGFVIKNMYGNPDLLKRISALELTWNENPSLIFLLKNIGPIIIFFPLGLIEFFKRSSVLKTMLFVFVLVSYVLFLSPVAQILGTHNLRFLSPVSYIFLGALGGLGMLKVAEISKKYRKPIACILFLILMIYFSVFNYETLYNRAFGLDSSTPRRIIDYLPKQIYEGFKFLKNQKEDNVLTGPYEYIGMLVATFSGKHVYLGRILDTSQFEEKQALAMRFFQGNMEVDEAKEFFLKNNINVVFLTSVDRFPSENLKKYSFLKEVYKSNNVSIFYLTNIKN